MRWRSDGPAVSVFGLVIPGSAWLLWLLWFLLCCGSCCCVYCYVYCYVRCGLWTGCAARCGVIIIIIIM